LITECDIQLAVQSDAPAIAALSRDCIERGLPRWSWTPERVLHCIHDRSTNVAIIRQNGILAGFAIMKYGEEEAQLFLFGVRPTHRRRGFGTALLSWLEATARTAGISAIWLQVRSTNSGAIAFYRSVGYKAMALNAGYYQGVEDALFMAKDTASPFTG
jgi:[ribosomal protein S18]-alanine N-acetyltransferase